MTNTDATWASTFRSTEFQRDLAELNRCLLNALQEHGISNPVLTGNLMYKHLQPDFCKASPDETSEEKRERLFLAAQRVPSDGACIEIGLNGGHSALILLWANPTLKVTAIDLCQHLSKDWGRVDIYVPAAAQWLKSRFGDRFTFIKGSSYDAVPTLANTKEANSVQMMHIDGAKETYRKDFLNALPMLCKRSTIVFDDYNMPTVKKQVQHLIDAQLLQFHPEFEKEYDSAHTNAVCATL